MIEIPDLELAVRLGAPALPAAEAMRGTAAAAARKHGLDAEDVTDVVRALHWLALGNPEHARSADMVGALLLAPRTAETCHRLGAAVDYVYAATVDHRRYGRPSDPLGLADLRLLGWRLTVALHVVRDEELRAARERSAM